MEERGLLILLLHVVIFLVCLMPTLVIIWFVHSQLKDRKVVSMLLERVRHDFDDEAIDYFERLELDEVVPIEIHGWEPVHNWRKEGF